jgi:hypothetical protein
MFFGVSTPAMTLSSCSVLNGAARAREERIRNVIAVERMLVETEEYLVRERKGGWFVRSLRSLGR